MVILNAAKDAVALLDKRGNIYSDRPALTMGGELVGWKNTLVMSPYGDRFREYRRFIAKFIGGRTQMQQHLALVEHETKVFLKRVQKSTDSELPSNIRK